jgi:hypothetical protein
MASRLVFSERAHTYSLDGQRVPSVSAIKGVLDKPGLMRWAANATASWAAAHAAELAQMGDESWRANAARASDQVRDTAATAGKQVHAIAERLVWGEPVPPEDPDGVPWTDDVRRMGEHLARFMDAWQVTPRLAEAMVFNEDHRYAGTLDLHGVLGDGNRWLIDYKTGASGPWQEVALQLCGYKQATHVSIGGRDLVMPDVDRCGVLWVRPDGWELVPVEVTDDTWVVFRACLFIWQHWSKVKRDDVVGAPLPVPDGSAA